MQSCVFLILQNYVSFLNVYISFSLCMSVIFDDCMVFVLNSDFKKMKIRNTVSNTFKNSNRKTYFKSTIFLELIKEIGVES